MPCLFKNNESKQHPRKRYKMNEQIQKPKKKRTTLILLSVIIILVLVIVGILIIRPAIQENNQNKINQGIEYAILSIMQQVATCQQVPLTMFNQTINIFAVECLGDGE